MTSVVTLQRETFRTGQSWAIGDVLHQTENRMRSAHATHLGYPYNLVGYSPVPASLGDYLVNNLGDPYVGSHYGSQTCDLEREAVAWLMDCGSATITMRSGPEFFQGRSLGHPVVRGRERLFRAPRTLSPDAEPGGSPRLAASGSGAGTGEVLSLSRHPVMEWKNWWAVLGGDDARALADILQAEIDSGRTEAYRTNNASEIAAPRGNTLEGLLTDMLNNSGYVCSPPHYNFSVENVQEFVAFLCGSGGFEIW